MVIDISFNVGCLLCIIKFQECWAVLALLAVWTKIYIGLVWTGLTKVDICSKNMDLDTINMWSLFDLFLTPLYGDAVVLFLVPGWKVQCVVRRTHKALHVPIYLALYQILIYSLNFMYLYLRADFFMVETSVTWKTVIVMRCRLNDYVLV